jgi:hypothetical protein
MIIDRVTITGADDSTDIQWMLQMQEKYPFVEWGILVSARSMGAPRFPSLDWIRRLLSNGSLLQLSTHVCGRWVRDICSGSWLPVAAGTNGLVMESGRVQLNFHGEPHELANTAVATAGQMMDKRQLIMQLDGVNTELWHRMLPKVHAVPLFDLSHGAGVLPTEWPRQMAGHYTGYAGGLGPRNIVEQVNKIKSVANGTIWLDMETRVRTEDDLKLDCAAVESVLQQCSQLGCLAVSG